MSLQGALPLIARPEVKERVNRAVDALDDTIGEIRSAIFALQARDDTRGQACAAGSSVSPMR